MYTIVESALSNKAFLISKRATWADPFLPNLKAEIDSIIQANLGIDTAQQLRLSTQSIREIQTQSMADLALFKTMLTEDFKNNKPRRTELLNQLGFTANLKKAQSDDQEALISLLYQFQTNMTPTLITEITTQGTDPALITTIIGYATNLKNANVTQESLKGAKKTINAATLTQYNAIYSKVISIAKIAAKLYKDQPDLQSQFSYSKVLKALNSTPPPPKK